MICRSHASLPSNMHTSRANHRALVLGLVAIIETSNWLLYSVFIEILFPNTYFKTEVNDKKRKIQFFFSFDFFSVHFRCIHTKMNFFCFNFHLCFVVHPFHFYSPFFSCLSEFYIYIYMDVEAKMFNHF